MNFFFKIKNNFFLYNCRVQLIYKTNFEKYFSTFSFFKLKERKYTYLSFINWFKSHIINYPTTANSNYFYSIGSVLGLFFVIQIITGLLLTTYYIPMTDVAFDSIEYIMRDVNYGWLFRYMHLNGASFIFFLLYFHIGRGLLMRSYVLQRSFVWYSGMLLFFLTIVTAFVGYVLPWAQMSYWAATVITNLVSAIPVIGNKVVLWLWGGHGVGGPTLSRFYTLHFILPFLLLVIICWHILLLHSTSSSNIISENIKNKITFYPYYEIKDLFLFLLFLCFFLILVFLYPNILNHPDNYIKANPLVTPKHIVPEWYFLPFYAILRAVTNKSLGIILMFCSIVIIVFLPKLDIWTTVQSPRFKEIHLFLFFLFITDFILLGFCGAQPVEKPYILVTQVLTFFYFFLYFVLFLIVPFLETNLIKNKYDEFIKKF